MVSGLVDTSIVVDILRAYSPALAWYQQQTDLGVGRAVWLEVIAGALDGRSQRTAIKLLQTFELLEITPEDGVWAAEKLSIYRLSHRVDAFDSLIAAPAFRLQVALYTQNLKHFTPMLGNLVVSPY